MANQGAKITIDAQLGRAAVATTIEQHGGNAHQIYSVGARLYIATLLFCVMRINISNNKAFATQSADKVFRKETCLYPILQTTLYHFKLPTAKTSDLLIDIANAFWGVLHRKRFSQDITMSV